jgi:hypothetical protein
MSHANALSATGQQLSAGLGVAAATVALRLGDPVGRALGDSTLETDYAFASLLLGLLPLAAIPGIARMRRDAGSAARAVRVPSEA